MLDDFPAPPLSAVLDDEPPTTIEEVSNAIKKLKNGKAPAVNGIPPKTIKAARLVVVEVLTKLFKLI